MDYRGHHTVASANPMFNEPLEREKFADIPSHRTSAVNSKYDRSIRYEILVMTCTCGYIVLLDAEFPYREKLVPDKIEFHKIECAHCGKIFFGKISQVTKYGHKSMLAKQYCENHNSPKKRYNPKQTQEEKDFSETHKLSDKELAKFMAESKAELKRQADLERKSFEKLLYEELLDPNADYRSQLNKDGIKQKKIKLTKKKYEEMDDEEIHRLRKKLETKQWKYCKFDPTRTYTTREKYGY